MELERLNEAEQRVLRLLAQGHTAKSIATAIGSTPTAVYERLREARRKTGVGSSRELARLLQSREICDKQLVIGGATDPVISVEPAGSNAARPNGKVLIAMTGLLLTGLVASLALHQNDSWKVIPDQPPFSDSLIGDIFGPKDLQKVALIPTTERDYIHGHAAQTAVTEAELRRLHAEVRTKRRDEQTEAKLRAIYKSIHPIKLSKAPFRVICSDSLCEVATTTHVPTPQPEIDATLGEVQGAELRQRADAIGLKPLYLWFGLHPSGDRAAYLGYWARNR